MDIKFKTETKRWMTKSKRVRRYGAESIMQSTEAIAKALFRVSKRNLKGPHYPAPKYTGPQTGKMPVPRMTANLARSLKMRKLMGWLWKVFSDGQVASYNIYVHNGTKRTKPRRFIGDVVMVSQRNWQKYMKKKWNAAMAAAQKF